MKKIIREKLEAQQLGSVKMLAASRQLLLQLSDGTPIDLSHLSNIPKAEMLVQELELLVRGRRRERGEANNAIKYLTFVSKYNLTINAESMRRYRDYLAGQESIGGNTKGFYYSTACSFVEQLIKNGRLKPQILPKNGLWEPRVPKPTLTEIAAGDLSEIYRQLSEKIQLAEVNYDLTHIAAQSLVLSEEWLSVLQQYSYEMVKRQIADWNYADSLISEYKKSIKATDTLTQTTTPEKINWSATNARSIEHAIKSLFNLYGYAAPRSKDWPKGLVDYCKYRGWTADRLRAALFPTVKSLDAFFMLGLTNDQLMPNVDSMIFYSYVNCVQPGLAHGTYEITLEKFRGSQIHKTFDHNTPIVIALMALTKKISSCLNTMPGFKAALNPNATPLFYHWSGIGRIGRVKTVNPSMTAYMVKRLIKAAAATYPILKPLTDRATGENFRPTHMLMRKLKGESIFTIQQDAHHLNPGTTAAYLDRIETESLHMKRKADFQRFILNEAADHKQSQIGNRFFSGNDSERFESDEYSKDEHRRIVFVTPEIVAEWTAWTKHIQNSRNYLEAHRKKRWNEIWEPILVEFSAYLESTSTATLDAASKLVDSIILPPLD